jgi:glycine cleavage system H protein
MAVVFVIATVLLCLAVNMVTVWWMKRRAAEQMGLAGQRPFLDVRFPCGLFLCQNHSWVRLTDSGELRIGADELITQALGGADRIELPAVGSEVRRGDPLATVWRLGRKIVLRTPSSGTVVGINDSLRKRAQGFGMDPYGIDWLVTLWPVEHTETLKHLRVGERATRWLEREIKRLTELLAAHTAPSSLDAVLADGAHPVVGSLLSLDDEGWLEFQEEFFATPELS